MPPRTRSIGVLWCPNQRQGRSNGWCFPPAVARHLRGLTKGKRVCHLFGGLAQWGTRLDIDPATTPHVRGDAWLPPFVMNAFDVTILDPPYVGINQSMKQQLLRSAAFISRESVIWFHTQWIATDRGLPMREAWLVRIGDSCHVRCIQVFDVQAGEKRRPRLFFSRGPAVRYNRWLVGQRRLPLERAI